MWWPASKWCASLLILASLVPWCQPRRSGQEDSQTPSWKSQFHISEKRASSVRANIVFSPSLAFSSKQQFAEDVFGSLVIASGFAVETFDMVDVNTDEVTVVCTFDILQRPGQLSGILASISNAPQPQQLQSGMHQNRQLLAQDSLVPDGAAGPHQVYSALWRSYQDTSSKYWSDSVLQHTTSISQLCTNGIYSECCADCEFAPALTGTLITEALMLAGIVVGLAGACLWYFFFYVPYVRFKQAKELEMKKRDLRSPEADVKSLDEIMLLNRTCTGGLSDFVISRSNSPVPQILPDGPAPPSPPPNFEW